MGDRSWKLADHLRCPNCGYTLDGVSALDGTRMPQGGDVSLCIDCATLLIFDDELELRVCPEDHPAQFDDTVVLARWHLQTLLGRRRTRRRA